MTYSFHYVTAFKVIRGLGKLSEAVAKFKDASIQVSESVLDPTLPGMPFSINSLFFIRTLKSESGQATAAITSLTKCLEQFFAKLLCTF